MIQKLIFITCIFFSTNSYSARKKAAFKEIRYLKSMYAHVHQNPSQYSSSMTTISCGHPIKVVEVVKRETFENHISNNWLSVIVGPYKGFVQEHFVSTKKETCFQDKYSRFFDSLNLNLTEMHYWGRLYDQYLYGKSKVQ